LIPLARRRYIIHKGKIWRSGTRSELEQSQATLDRHITV
jgi:ABC-type branched-subunit amino acid transport system ATPase component